MRELWRNLNKRYKKFKEKIKSTINSIPKIRFENGNIIITKKVEGDSILDSLKRTLYVFIAVVLVHSFLFSPYLIQSGSMEPTLFRGDYTIVSRYSYGYNRNSFLFKSPLKKVLFKRNLKRGDIAAFKLPSDTSITYVKRILGLPGDTIQMKNSVLYINEQPLPKKFLGFYQHKHKNGHKKKSENDAITRKFLEILPEGKEIKILHFINDDLADNTPLYIVPKNHYFFIGDNRDDSMDSRFRNVGFIPHDNIVGKVRFVLFTRSGLKGRMFKAIH